MRIQITNIEALFQQLNPLFPVLLSNIAFYGITAQDFSGLRLYAKRNNEGGCRTKIASILNAFSGRVNIAPLQESFLNLKKRISGDIVIAEDAYEEDFHIQN